MRPSKHKLYESHAKPSVKKTPVPQPKKLYQRKSSSKRKVSSDRKIQPGLVKRPSKKKLPSGYMQRHHSQRAIPRSGSKKEITAYRRPANPKIKRVSSYAKQINQQRKSSRDRKSKWINSQAVPTEKLSNLVSLIRPNADPRERRCPR